MPRRLGRLALAACVGLFALGLLRLFQERFETGDIYPRYSTWRSDPFGCRALFESLRRYPGLRPERALAREDLARPGDPAWLFLGVDAESLPEDADLLRAADSLA